jgi:membrane protein YdbS with pleckstrin-like domain
MMPRVAISRRLLNDGETVVVDTRTHVKALLLPLLCLVVLLAIGVLVQTQVDDGTALLVVWVVLALAAAWFVLRPLLEWLAATYTVTDRRLITRHGVLVRRGHDIPLSRISDVAYEFGPVDRLLGCGTLVISDASTQGQVRLPDIPHVEETQRSISRLLHEADGADRADRADRADGTTGRTSHEGV